MDIEVLKEFITLSEKLNFSETAKIHFITQPVLSKHIQQLEKEVGVTLFYRSRQSVVLTKLGELFLNDAQVIVSSYTSALKKIAFAAQEYNSSFSVSFLDAAARDFLPTMISEFYTRHPATSLQLFNATSIPQTLQMLESRECDVSITVKSPLQNFTDYDYMQIYRDDLCVALPDYHPLAKQTTLTLQEVKEERFITASPNLTTEYQMAIDYLLKKKGVSHYIKKDSNSVEEGFLLVESGYGISVVPKHQHYFSSDHVKLIPLKEDDCYIDVVIVWRKDNNNPNIKKFTDIFREIILNK